MGNIFSSVLLAVAMIAAPAVAQEAPQPPVALKKPHDVVTPFGARRSDPYYWLRDDTRQNPEVLANLVAENAYADSMLSGQKRLQSTVLKEIVGRINGADATVPYRKRGFDYTTRFEAGSEYPIIARRKASPGASEEVLLDQPKMALGKPYFAVSAHEISPDNRFIAYAEDTIGRRQYEIRIKDLSTKELRADTIANAEPNFVWADDNRTIFYIEKDPVTLLSKRVKAHVLGTSATADRLVYEEADDSFICRCVAQPTTNTSA